MFLPRGLHRATHHVPRPIPFQAEWLPPGFDPLLRPGPSGLGYSTANWHWMGETALAAIDVYDNVVGSGRVPMIKLEHEQFDSMAIVKADEPLARFIVEDRRLFCGYAIAGHGISSDDLIRVCLSLTRATQRR